MILCPVSTIFDGTLWVLAHPYFREETLHASRMWAYTYYLENKPYGLP